MRKRTLPLRQRQFLLLRVEVNQREQDGLVFSAKDSARNFSEELLQDGGDRVHWEAVDVDKAALLQEVDQLVHVALEKGKTRR